MAQFCMKYLKLFEEFSDSGFKHDFNFNFGGDNDDFYAEVNLAERIIRIEIPLEADFEPGNRSWYDPKHEIDLICNDKGEHTIEMINSWLEDCHHNHTIPVKIFIDDNETKAKVNDNTFIAMLKVNGETYNDWIIKTKRPKWSARLGKKYGL
jgi:hypothetical protein